MPQDAADDRYSRQVLFAPIGAAGQARLASASAVLIGCGALGSVSASLLARAGVGRLRLVDRDFVEISNLQRQLLYDEEDVREMKPKAVAAAEKLARANGSIRIEPVVADVNPDTIVDLTRGHDLILDGTDNFETRFLINDVSVRHDIPWIYGACLGSYGLVMNILPGETACLTCLMESAPPPGSVPTCDTAGILNTTVALVSSLQCTEALKLLSGQRDLMSHDLLSVDLWTQTVTRLSVPKGGGRRRCETCDGMAFTYLSGRGSRSVSICGRNAVQITPETRQELSLADLAARLSPTIPVTATRFLVRFEVDKLTVSVFPDARAIITGTKDPAVARSLYARYVGV